MDVTFSENTSLYPKKSLKGENRSETNIYTFFSKILRQTLPVSSNLTPSNPFSFNLHAIDHNLNLENGNNSERNSETEVLNLDAQQ